MRRRLVIITEIISPYRIPLFNALARSREVDPHVIFLAETDPNLRQWRVYKEEICFSFEVLPSWRQNVGNRSVLLNRGLARALGSASPHAVLCGGYNYLASWQALFWARAHQVPFLLWSESHLDELRGGHPLVEFMKTEFLRNCDGFVVPGVAAREYLRAHKIRDRSIFAAPNAVDNNLFAAAADVARLDAEATRCRLCLPSRYFLFAGRLVREKGVFDLLAAYAKLEDHVRKETGLVFVGDGELRPQLEEQARAVTPGMIRFAGFAHREQLAAYYALAEVLVLPTHTDTWGLVVNEAMACGLPVILSRAAGCAADLVRENWNGIVVPPADVSALAATMQKLAGQPDLCVTMGMNSLRQIRQYSPEAWSEGMVRTLAATGAVHD